MKIFNFISSLLFFVVSTSGVRGQENFEVTLPAGVQAMWDLGKAQREATPSRERICLNGLWRWQPSSAATESVPTGNWGFFKVPGPWPGITDYMQKDCQEVFLHPSWKNEKLANISAAWHEREIFIPEDWTGRQVLLTTSYLNSFAAVYVDGKKAGEMRFPSGEVDLSTHCRAGQKHILSVLVLAMPLKGVMLSFTDSASAREIKGAVARRGLCGDLYLEGIRKGPRIDRVTVNTSVRNSKITLVPKLSHLEQNTTYRLRAAITQDGHAVKDFESRPFTSGDLQKDAFSFTESWRPEKLWDIHTPLNQYELVLSLSDAEGTTIDTSQPVSFGFRELWISGRDFYLNGTRIFLSAVPLDNAQVGAAWATYEAARESLERLKSFGINFVYSHNYGCEPGSHLNFEQILKAADDVGMLVALSQPHFSQYDWKTADADQANGYLGHAEFYASVAGNHPSVVFYAMSHNATGYSEDMNPDMIDGLRDVRDQWASNNAKLALRAEAIVTNIDPARIVYHHASGNLGTMHPINFYPNFVPAQEMSDWFGHWSTNGVKPAFLCEYAAPFTWDWTMYRGWYKGEREFGSAKVPWEFCVAEWNAQFFGDVAYQVSEAEKANLRWEAKQFRAGNLWHRWDYPYSVGSSAFEERYPVFALYIKDNWRAFRTWGVSAISPWEYEHFWKLRAGVNKGRQQLKVDWENLQRPGYSPDYIAERYERMDLAFNREDWVPTVAAKALLDHNGPLLGFIAGKPSAFTGKDHNFQPGELLEKQIIVINNSREAVSFIAEWALSLPEKISGSAEHDLRTGEQMRIPLQFRLPENLSAGTYELSAKISFAGGIVQQDAFQVNVLPHAPPVRTQSRIALFDPKGETAASLTRNGIKFRLIDAKDNLSEYEIVILGKAALTVTGPVPDLARVSEGLKVVVFEQTAAALERRLGFRVAEYGLRQVFPRIPEHPLLAGIATNLLRDWRGEATILPPRLEYELRPRHGPTVKWCDIQVPRLWRCGNRGNVASVLIEKPPGGDFLSILDGGYGLQYSPLLEYRQGKGMILLCQLDLTGRTENDPVAEKLGLNILRYASEWKPQPRREVAYFGEPAGRIFLEKLGVAFAQDRNETFFANHLLVIGPGGEKFLSARKQEIERWLGSGGNLLSIGLPHAAANAFLPFSIATRDQEHIATYFTEAPGSSFLAGVGPADLQNRDPRIFPLLQAGPGIVGNGILGSSQKPNVIFCQAIPWEYENHRTPNVKRTYRRYSFVVSRLLANMGAARSSSFLAHFSSPPAENEKRWLSGLYLDEPEEWDDPYRFFRW